LRDGKKEGEGVYIYSNGNKYEGQWSLDRKHGRGLYYYNTKGERYDG